MKINCKIADDLLPLYLDDICSDDSRTALDKHLKECAVCRAKLTRMQSGIIDDIQAEKSVPKLANYAKKVRKHKIQVIALVIFVTIIASVALALIYLTIRDMHERSAPHIFELEAGTYNLAAGNLETLSEEINKYVLYTNDAEITVTVRSEGNFQGTVMLWDAAYNSNFIQISDVNEEENTCTFISLSAARRYKITCDNLDGATITVSASQTISFWNSLKSVIYELIRG